MATLSAKEAREMLSYDAETGTISWLVFRGSNALRGDVAGTKTIYGYIQVRVKQRFYKAHRLAFLLKNGKWPKEEVDHINGNQMDNRWCNLRQASRFQNAKNVKLRSDNVTGFKGVSWHKRANKFYARIAHNGKQIYIGLFLTAEDANRAYREKAKELFGDFCRS